MKRRRAMLLAALGIMVTIAAMGQQKGPNLLLLEWAHKAKAETPPMAILIEMGVKDNKPSPWSGQAKVEGAKVVHREGYRFRAEDRLIEPNAWHASSHRQLRLPPRNAALAALEGPASVGIVLHLTDIQADASLTLTVKDQEIDGVMVSLRDLLAGQPKSVAEGVVVVRRISTALPLATGKTEDDFPAAAYGPDGTLWVAYISYTLKEESRRIEPPQLKQQPANFKAYDTPEFGDQLFVKYRRDGKWSEPVAITGAKEDMVRCAIAVEGNGTPWVVYGANRSGKYDIFARSLGANGAQPGAEERLTNSTGSNINPALCTDQGGNLRLSYQSWREDGPALIATLVCEKGKWTPGSARFGGRDGNAWYPTTAAGPHGETATAYDVYDQGDYDIGLHLQDAKTASDQRVASTPKFEARPSAAYDTRGRLWIAYEEGPEQWGKDYGALEKKPGNPLYASRSVRVVCLENGKLFKPVAELPNGNEAPPRYPYQTIQLPGGAIVSGSHFEKQPRYSSPQIGIDGKGRVWLTYREKFGNRYSCHPGSYWLTFARRLDGDQWTPPIEIHHSDGLLDSRPVVLPHAGGGLVVVHNTDGRYTTPETVQNQVYFSYLDLPGDPVEPKLVGHYPGKKDEKAAADEQAAVKRSRDYSLEAGGKKYQFLRGEFHRHTEISWDGGPDGSLEDMFRYAIDAAAMDWIGNGDHDNGAGREYAWWLVQKFTDAYHIKNRFTPMFSYERSVAYPHGHRNCVFARRGIRTLPRLAEEDMKKRVAGIHADDTKMLYRYLKELDGVCAVHTSATSMGTDWRDNDPQVEPMVEIYQGDRMSYEIEGAPRAGYDPQLKKYPANIAGWFPKGFINLALQKGYRLGFQSSSDHWSTHISFCIVLAERHDRQGILDAMKKRHVYGATDDIILDVHSGTHVMGDEFKSTEPPTLQIRVIGTKPLAKVEILKDSEVVHTQEPGKPEYQGTWTDPKPTPGVHYYYVRVQQADGELAWGSPMWIDFSK